MKTVSLVAFKRWLDVSLSRIEREKKEGQKRGLSGEILGSVIGAGAEFEEKMKNEKSPLA